MGELGFRTVAEPTKTATRKPWNAHFDKGPSDYSILTLSNGFKNIDTRKARRLLEDSFGKELSKDYFRQQAKLIVLEGDYRGIAIVKRLAGADYLDKFAVSPSAQGNGIGSRIWDKLEEKCSSFIWRASPLNVTNERIYFKRSDGHHKGQEWTVFWRGMDLAKVAELIPLVEALPRTMLAASDVFYGER